MTIDIRKELDIQLTKDQEIWMNAVYEKFKNNENISQRNIFLELQGKISIDFTPKDIGNRILWGDDKIDITLIGILCIDPETKYIKMIDTIIRFIKGKICVKNSDVSSITAAEIAYNCNYTKVDVQQTMYLIKHIGDFSNSASGTKSIEHRPEYEIWEEWKFDNNIAFLEYYRYTDFETLLKKYIQQIQPSQHIGDSQTIARSTQIYPQSNLLPPVMEPYEHILRIIIDAAIGLERTPDSHKILQEPDFRNTLVTTLNTHYRGQATGETFNFNGKTDILLRDTNNKNIFIAECKIWNGPQSLTDAINQLLSYATWRDNRTAILIFNRNKNLSNVLAKIPETIEKHDKYKRKINEYSHETGFRYAFGHKDDENREIIITVLVFEVPQ